MVTVADLAIIAGLVFAWGWRESSRTAARSRPARNAATVMIALAADPPSP